MKRVIILQSILLLIVFICLSIFLSYFSIPIALALGLIPFFYHKKYGGKEILKINFLSSLFSFIGMVIVYVIFLFIDHNFAPNGLVWQVILNIIDLRFFLQYGLLSALLFNVPFGVYFLFRHKNQESVQ